MADTPEVFRGLHKKPGVRYWALVPNLKGLQSAVASGVRNVAVFVSSSETHNRTNLNRTIAESLENLATVLTAAAEQGTVTRGYVSTSFGCPYEGVVPFDHVMRIAERLLELGCLEVSLGDTTGMGTPLAVREGCRRAVEAFGADKVALHLHDTRGLGLVNALQALEVGVRTFDSAIGGMGGCPYAPGASGNLGTEDLVYMLESLGYDCGVDLDRVVEVSRDLELEHGATLNSRFFRYATSLL
jgi:hydroxymethylglutaryl-CoA lyase